MSQLKRYYGENDLHFLTTSPYRRARVFDSERFKLEFVATLAKLRAEQGFRLLGYVLRPEHFHLLVWPSERADPSQIMQRLKGRTARSILKTLRQERRHAWRVAQTLIFKCLRSAKLRGVRMARFHSGGATGLLRWGGPH